MVLKRHQNPKGGLNEAGRKHFELVFVDFKSKVPGNVDLK